MIAAGLIAEARRGEKESSRPHDEVKSPGQSTTLCASFASLILSSTLDCQQQIISGCNLSRLSL